MAERLNEHTLVHQVLQGNSQAARRLYKIIAPKLRQFFSSKIAEDSDVDELVQDTFLHLLDALPLFRFQSQLATFARSIANHELADYWRKRYTKRLIRTVPIIKDLPASPYTSERTARTMNQALERAYASIHPLQAQVLRWKYEDGLSMKEIAAELGMTVKAVEAQLYRARKAFQAAYIEPEIIE